MQSQFCDGWHQVVDMGVAGCSSVCAGLDCVIYFEGILCLTKILPNIQIILINIAPKQQTFCIISPMPSKPGTKNRRSQQTVPQLIAIYEILSDKEQDSSVRKLAKKIEAVIKHDVTVVEKSFVVFVLKICGLDGCVDKISWREPVQSLSQLLQEMCEENQKSIVVSELFIINEKSKFHKEFLKRIRQFLGIVLSEELALTTETEVLKKIYETLLTISKCKMRNIRHCSVVLAGLVMKKAKIFYDDLIKQKQNRRATKILNLIDDKYLQEFIKPRLKDIDPQIRQKAFEIADQTFLSLSQQLINSNKLQKFYTQILADNKAKITQLCLKSITKLFEVDKQKINAATNRHLSTYAGQLIKSLEELILIPNRNSCLAMDTLLSIHSFAPHLNCLKPKLIAKVFEIHGYEKFQEGLKKAVSVFFKSLINFTTKQDLVQHRSLLIVEITHLLCSINSSRLLATILKQFFVVHANLFSFDEMFLLLLTEYYNREGSDIELQQKQLHVLCAMICQFNIYLKSNKNMADRQKQELSYNKNILTNCKEIFYEKITKHQSICHLYLRLFSLLYTPISGNISNYLSFVQEKTLNFVKQEQFLTIAGEDLILTQQMINQCASICQSLYKDNVRIDPILKSFGIYDLLNKQKYDDVDIFKVAALNSRFYIEDIVGEKVFKKVLTIYNRLQDKITKLDALSYAYHSLKWSFTSLFNSPSQSKHQLYITIRDVFMDFVIEMVLGSASEDTVVKVAAFNVICRTLKLISNSKISDVPALYFDPSSPQMEIIYGFVSEYIRFDDEEVSETTMMMASISLESHEIRQQILQNLFEVFSQSLRLSLHKFSIRFIISFINSNSTVLKPAHKYMDNFLNELIKSEISEQNSNKFIFWRVYSEVIAELHDSDEQKQNRTLDKFIDSYYKYRKNQAQIKSKLSNKLMLYIADSIDKSLNNANYANLIYVKYLLGKTKRRFQKQILQRLCIFFVSKIADIEDKNVKSMKDFLNKISKVKKAKSTKEKNSDHDSSESQKQEDEEQNENDENDRNNGQNIMVQTSPEDRDRRNTRSKNKRKGKN